ncbi:MAG: 50S ribosomal protein L25 [Calditrichaceae bacterium]
MSEIMLNAEKRGGNKKVIARGLRREGKVPAILYGQDKDPALLILDAHQLELMLKKDYSIIKLEVAGKEKQAVIKEIQYHPVTGKVLHVDFLRVAAGHVLKVTVPLHFEGEAPGIKAGGNFNIVKHELDIEVLPKNMPDYIKVDISALEIGDSIRVKDIKVENMEVFDDLEDMVCVVAAPKEIEVEEEEEEIEEESAEPEVITARAKDDEDSEK